MTFEPTGAVLPRLLYTREDLRRFGVKLSNSTLLRLEARGAWPRRVRLGAHSVAWPADEIHEHLAQLRAARSAVVDGGMG